MKEFADAARTQAKRISDNMLPPPPSYDPFVKWNLWSDPDTVNDIIVGILHADSRLDANKIAEILRARNPTAYGTMTDVDVGSIFSWLRNNPDAPNNPYNVVFDKKDGVNGPWVCSHIHACMRASIALSLLEQEGGVPYAKERAHERMETLKDDEDTYLQLDAFTKDTREREQREAEQEKHMEEKHKGEEETVMADNGKNK